MKKLLALVLALVMTLGLATVAANASYPDDSDIEYKEAVDVMSAVGVFQGDEKGNFMPKANLDRAAAAKLIAYLDLGEKAAEALPAVKVFNDVPASHWAAKYIAYCANAEYIVGAGDGNFYPSNPLTGYAFGKMILCVLGYDAAIEGFTGATWSINVAKLMDDNDIDDGVDGNASATLTREQAAKYCLNALQADMVEYDTKGTSIEINGAKIATGASKATSVEDKNNSKDYNGKTDGLRQLTEKLYGNDLKLTGTPSDKFNAPATQWKYKNSTVGTFADSPDETYKNKVTKNTIYTLLGKDVVDDVEDGNALVQVSVDGAALTAEAVDSKWKNNSGAAFGTDNGMVTEVYIDDDGNGGYALVTVVVKNVYVMQATDDYNTKTEKLGVDPLFATAYKKTTVTEDDVADGVSFDSFKEDDYILYTYAKGEIQSMEKAETLTGKVTGYTSGKNVTIGGTKYSYNVSIDDTDTDNGKAVTYKTNEEATVVLDALGYIVYVDEAVAGNDNVYFVVGVDTDGFGNTKAQIVTVDGKKQVIDASSKSDTVAADKVYAFKADGSKTKLTDYDSAKWGTANPGKFDFNKNTSVITGKKANADTVYIVEDDDEEITLYTGVKNAPDSVQTADKVLFVNNTDNELLYVYIVAVEDGIDEHSSSSDQLIYILKSGDTITDSDDNEYIEVKALVDGSETTLNVDSGTTFAVGGFYTKQKVNSDGYVTAFTSAKVGDDYANFTVADTDNAFTFSSDVFEAVGADSWYVDGTKVHLLLTGKANNELLDDANASYELNETTFKALETFVKGYKVSATGWVVLNDDGEATEAFINITKATEN